MALTPSSTDHPDPNGIADRLRDLRLQRGLRQEEVALRCGMSPAVLSRKETGKQPLNHTDITRLINVFKLSPGEAFDLWCAAGMVAHAPFPDWANGAMSATVERLGYMDVPALLLYRSGNLRAWNGCAEVIFQPSRGQVRCTALHIFDVLAAWEPSATDPQMQRESVSSLLSFLAPLITVGCSNSSVSIILHRLPNTPIGALIRECWPSLVRVSRRAALRERVYPVVYLPTPVGVISFLLTSCMQAYTSGLILVTLIPKYTDGTANCDQLRELHQHIIQTVYVRE